MGSEVLYIYINKLKQWKTLKIPNKSGRDISGIIYDDTGLILGIDKPAFYITISVSGVVGKQSVYGEKCIRLDLTNDENPFLKWDDSKILLPYREEYVFEIPHK